MMDQKVVGPIRENEGTRYSYEVNACQRAKLRCGQERSPGLKITGDGGVAEQVRPDHSNVIR